MVEELVPILEETPGDKTPYAIAFMGNTGAYHRIRSMGGVLTEQFGEGNFTLHNSYLSLDAKEPERYEDMAREIGDLLASGRPLTIYAYSFGSVEFMHAMDKLKNLRPELFKDPQAYKQFTFKLVDPAGIFDSELKGRSAAFQYLKEVAHLGKLSLLQPGSWHEAVDSTILFPPRNMTNDDVSGMLRELYPEQSRAASQPDVPVIPFAEPKRDYWEKLDTTTRNYLDDLDRQIAEFLKEGNTESARTAMSVRAKALQPKKPWERSDKQYHPKKNYREAVYSGEYYKEPREEYPQINLKNVKHVAQAVLGFIPLFRETFSGVQVERYEEMVKGGAKIEFLTPEFSVFTPQSHIIKGATQRVMERLTHASQTPQPESIYNEALKPE